MNKLDFNIYSKQIVDYVKTNPLVEGIFLQYDNSLGTLLLQIISNDNFKYIERTTGKSFFKNSKLISVKIDLLYWIKRGYEGAIESPDIVPNTMELFAPVNLEAAEIVDKEIDDWKTKLHDVNEAENAIFKEFIEKSKQDLDEKIKSLQMKFGMDLLIINDINHNFENKPHYQTIYDNQNCGLLFNRFNRIKLITKKQEKELKTCVLIK